MKITKILAASRREDLIKQRDEYDAETKKFQDKVDEGEKNLRSKLREQRLDMEKKISDLIGSTSLDLEIYADPWGSYTNEGWSVRVKANDSNKFDDNVALSWSWEAKLGSNGEVSKESGSWSGLKAVTPEQIADLEESVRVIKILNSMNWEEVLNSPKAKFEDYVPDDDQKAASERRRNRPDFEKDIEEAEIEDAVGGNIAFELSQDQYYRGNVFILPTGVTDKFIKGYIFPEYIAENKTKDQIINDYLGGDVRRTSRSNLKKNGRKIELK